MYENKYRTEICDFTVLQSGLQGAEGDWKN